MYRVFNRVLYIQQIICLGVKARQEEGAAPSMMRVVVAAAVALWTMTAAGAASGTGAMLPWRCYCCILLVNMNKTMYIFSVKQEAAASTAGGTGALSPCRHHYIIIFYSSSL
jgi:hypothetical protein